MAGGLQEIFEDEKLVNRIKTRLPYLFRLAELESSRAGRIGMQVGSLRERIIVALLIYKFGKANVETEIPITEPEVDVKLYGVPISIKTKSGKGLSGIKVSWTVDAQTAKEFQKLYEPVCDILYVNIVWGGIGGFCYIPKRVQKAVLKKLGNENYIKLPKPGTNPRGIEFTRDAFTSLIEHKLTRVIEIQWEKREINYDPYKRWVDYWRED
ncbi:MAG: type II restriction endonuclease subunit R [candidate division Zixibacteria bacterium 4484_93]|nr:MAG: type II restriction endonuclease subunit R [candidate division Zixibacteria bacterium 4484_93]